MKVQHKIQDLWSRIFDSSSNDYCNLVGYSYYAFISYTEKDEKWAEWLQWELEQVSPAYKDFLEAHGGIDGKCGSSTTELLRLFQINYGLEPVDMVCGRKTRAALKKN